MDSESLVHAIFLIFTGAAILASLALYARQSLIIAYIFLGVLIGPWGLALVPEPEIIEDIASVGIIFLLFLLGLDLDPHSLSNMFSKAMITTLLSSLLFAGVGFVIALSFQFGFIESVVIGATMMFSSTILGLKLLPTTVLHHRHLGEIIISVLLIQDLIAIFILIIFHGASQGNDDLLFQFGKLALTIPMIILLVFLIERYLLLPLIARFDTIREYIFLVALGWCLGIAELANYVGLSVEIGAFVAGIALARRPIAVYIAESLRPLRDFFLVMFFFSLGAGFDLSMFTKVIIPAASLAVFVLIFKPLIFRWLLRKVAERPRTAKEAGFRLGQISEFSLLITIIALQSGYISAKASYVIQLATLITFIFSSYYIVMKYPTPISTSEKLRRD
ncbi:MAG: cation:proton antiporter [Gammaproteobacteria bacterium]